MKKYQYLASWDDQTLTRVGEPVVVLGDSNVSQVEVTLPSNFLLDPTKAECRMYFLLPGEKESNHDVLETAVKDENGDSHVTWTIKHVHSQKGGRLAFSLTLIGDDAQWDSRTAIIPVYESRYQPESEEAEDPYTGRLDALEGSMASIRGEFAEVQDDFEELKETATLGTPIPESLVANMQEGHVYIYTGTEPGYTAGHVYYYVGGTLTDGGVYGGTAVDATLTQSGQAADAAVTGAEISAIKEDLSDTKNLLLTQSDAVSSSTLTIGKYRSLENHTQINDPACAFSGSLITSTRKGVTMTNTDYEFAVNCYSSTPVSSSTLIRGIGWCKANAVIVVPENAYAIVCQVKKINGSISESETDAIKSAFIFFVPTDKTLSIANKAADAKVTGDNIRALQSAMVAQEIDKSTATVIDYYMAMANGEITSTGVTVKTLYFKCAKNTLYHINHALSGRFVAGCFSAVPANGSIPTSFVIGTSPSKQEDSTYILTDDTAEYLAMYYYSSTYSVDTESNTYNALSIHSLPSDPSLTYAGIPAESKATGNAIKDIPLGFYVSHDTVSLVNTYSGVIALYDALVSAHGDYISKNALTKGGITLYEYILTSGNYNAKLGKREQDDEIMKPTLLITSGVHGYEQSSVMALYSLCKALCENRFDLVDVKDYVTLRIIPVVCPSGYDANSRLNSNNVNINRNFASSSWTQTSVGQDYSGSSAGSETETQIVQEWLTEHKTEAIAYIDWHNSNYTDEISCLLGSVTETAMAFKAKYLLGINKVIPYWRKNRNIGDSNIYAYSGHTTTGGTAKSYGDDLGILSFTFETSWNVASSGKHSTFTIGTGCEAFANMLIGLKSYFDL